MGNARVMIGTTSPRSTVGRTLLSVAILAAFSASAAAGAVTFEYEVDSNIELAPYLKGKPLLTTGDVDNNVHPANTIRMAHALIRANKRFDYFIFPSQRHGFGNMSDYWFWLRAEYFARHLLGDSRTAPDVSELNAERERR